MKSHIINIFIYNYNFFHINLSIFYISIIIVTLINWIIIITLQIVTTLAGIVFYPYDTVRKRMMMQSGRSKTDTIYANTLDCWIEVVKTEGVDAFFKSTLPNILHGTGDALVLTL